MELDRLASAGKRKHASLPMVGQRQQVVGQGGSIAQIAEWNRYNRSNRQVINLRCDRFRTPTITLDAVTERGSWKPRRLCGQTDTKKCGASAAKSSARELPTAVRHGLAWRSRPLFQGWPHHGDGGGASRVRRAGGAKARSESTFRDGDVIPPVCIRIQVGHR